MAGAQTFNWTLWPERRSPGRRPCGLRAWLERCSVLRDKLSAAFAVTSDDYNYCRIQPERNSLFWARLTLSH